MCRAVMSQPLCLDSKNLAKLIILFFPALPDTSQAFA